MASNACALLDDPVGTLRDLTRPAAAPALSPTAAVVLEEYRQLRALLDRFASAATPRGVSPAEARLIEAERKVLTSRIRACAQASFPTQEDVNDEDMPQPPRSSGTPCPEPDPSHKENEDGPRYDATDPGPVSTRDAQAGHRAQAGHQCEDGAPCPGPTRIRAIGAARSHALEAAREQTVALCGREILWNPEFLRFARHYAFEPRVCRPRDPNRKGKIEAPFPFVERDLLAGRAFDSWHDLDQAAMGWLRDVANRRVHRTTGQVPEDAWMSERDFLTALPETSYPVYRQEIRPVSDDGLVAVDGTRYSVPANELGARRTVSIRVYPRRLEILDREGRILATHRKPDLPGGLIIQREHYDGLRRRRECEPGETERRFLARFPEAGAFLDGLKKRMKSLYPLHLIEIQRLAGPYGEEPVRRAIERAARYGNFSAYAVRRILRARHPLVWPEAAVTLPGPASVGDLDDIDSGSFDDYASYTDEDDQKEGDA